MTDEHTLFNDLRRPKPQDNYEVATGLAFECLRRQTHEQLQWLGAVSDDGCWRLPVLSEALEVRTSSRQVVTSSGREVGAAWRILTLHYLAVATRPDLLSPSVTFDDLATARSYGGVYRQRVIARLCATAGQNLERLCNAASLVHGHASEGGEASFRFDVFPRVQVRLVWHAPDEEFPPSATILLPANIESYFCAEDIVVLSEGLVARLSGRPF